MGFDHHSLFNPTCVPGFFFNFTDLFYGSVVSLRTILVIALAPQKRVALVPCFRILWELG